MTNDTLHELKQYYLTSDIHDEKVNQLWQDLSGNLPPRMESPFYFRARYAFLSVIALVLLGSSITLVQAAQPDSALYPLRVMADSLSAKATGKYSPVIDRRTDDIIKAAGRNSNSGIQKATKALSNSLDDVKTASLSSESKSKVKSSLNASESKLRTVSPANQAAQTSINNAIEKTETTQKEVKGAQTSHQGNSGNNSDHSPSDNGQSHSQSESHGSN